MQFNQPFGDIEAIERPVTTTDNEVNAANMFTQDGTTIVAPWLTDADTNRPGTVIDLELIGMSAGVIGAKEIIRLGIRGKNNPYRSLAIKFYKDGVIDFFVKDQRANNNLTDEGEQAFRNGLDRGMTLQLASPNASIEIKLARNSAVV